MFKYRDYSNNQIMQTNAPERCNDYGFQGLNSPNWKSIPIGNLFLLPSAVRLSKLKEVLEKTANDFDIRITGFTEKNRANAPLATVSASFNGGVGFLNLDLRPRYTMTERLVDAVSAVYHGPEGSELYKRVDGFLSALIDNLDEEKNTRRLLHSLSGPRYSKI